MSPKLTKAIDQSRTFLSTLNPKQKSVLGGSVLATLGFFAVLMRFIGNGDLKILYSGLPPAEAQEVVRRLGAKEIPYELSKDGTSISVPAWPDRRGTDAIGVGRASQERPPGLRNV